MVKDTSFGGRKFIPGLKIQILVWCWKIPIRVKATSFGGGEFLQEIKINHPEVENSYKRLRYIIRRWRIPTRDEDT
jgi:hypothetical protein